MRLRAIAAALLAAASSASGDVVTLVDGRRLEGSLVETDAGLVLRGRLGEVELERADVLLVDRQPTVDERFDQERARTDPTDPDALALLASWCRSHRLPGQARELEARRALLLAERAEAVRLAQVRLREATLARRRAGAGDDPASLFEVARWAERERFGRAEVETLVRDVLALDPAHAGALGWFERRAAEEEARVEREAAQAARQAEERRRQAAAAAEEGRRDAVARAERRRIEAETEAAGLQAREQAARVRQAEAEAQAAADRAAAWAAERARAAQAAYDRAVAYEEQRRCQEAAQAEAQRRAWRAQRREEDRRRREAEEEAEPDAIRLRGGTAARAGAFR